MHRGTAAQQGNRGRGTAQATVGMRGMATAVRRSAVFKVNVGAAASAASRELLQGGASLAWW